MITFLVMFLCFLVMSFGLLLLWTMFMTPLLFFNCFVQFIALIWSLVFLQIRRISLILSGNHLIFFFFNLWLRFCSWLSIVWLSETAIDGVVIWVSVINESWRICSWSIHCLIYLNWILFDCLRNCNCWVLRLIILRIWIFLNLVSVIDFY